MARFPPKPNEPKDTLLLSFGVAQPLMPSERDGGSTQARAHHFKKLSISTIISVEARWGFFENLAAISLQSFHMYLKCVQNVMF